MAAAAAQRWARTPAMWRATPPPKRRRRLCRARTRRDGEREAEAPANAHARYLQRGAERSVFYDALDDGVDGGARAAALGPRGPPPLPASSSRPRMAAGSAISRATRAK